MSDTVESEAQPSVVDNSSSSTSAKSDYAVPILADYDIDPVSGFLSNPPPLRRLPADFERWEFLLDNLHQLLTAGVFRSYVRKLPLMDIGLLNGQREQQRAFLLLTMVAHSYIIGIPKADAVEPVLPECIAVPWFSLATLLDLKPVISYVSIELFNWYLLDPSGPLDLSNIAMQHTFSGVVDEAWFYLIPLGIEAIAAPAVKGLVDAQQAILDGAGSNETATAALTDALTVVAESTEKITALLKRMYEKCDPQIFWTRIRNYSGGSKNSATMPNGIFFEGVTTIDAHVNPDAPPPAGRIGTWRRYAGASAGQSPVIHTLDVGLDIHHAPMHAPPSASSQPPSDTPRPNPMLEMREYLSSSQRKFLIHLASGPSIRTHVATLGTSHPAAVQFNRAVSAVKAFRDTHIQLTTVYILLQQKKEAAASGLPSAGAVGTGGTDLVPFLKQTRQETVDALIKTQTQ